MATAFETRQSELLLDQSFSELQQKFPDHFTLLRQPARALVGQEVPSVTGQGKERLRDAADAKDWQESMRQVITEQANSLVETKKDELRAVFDTVHASIDLFSNNTDLIHGTKQFDKELADAFAAAARDYEQRVDGKLIGWSVPVQPIINALRAQLVTKRAATPAPVVPATPSAQQQRAAEQPRTPGGQFDGPQAGIISQAGQSAAPGEDEAQNLMGAFFRQNGLVL